MSKLYLGSIDLNKINKSDIVTKDKNGNPFTNGAKYLNVSIWVNDEPDQYGNHLAVKAGGKDNSYYVGNAKEYVKQGEQQQQSLNSQPMNPITDELDDLPY